MQIELARPGKFGQDGTVVTEQDLADVAETFKDEAPVTLGHQLADWMPAFGWVKSVAWDAAKKVLTGDVQLGDMLTDAEAAGLYKKWSVGIRTLADTGKRYLHHLAFLGAIPPKVKGLNIINMADAQTTWTFGDDTPPPQNPNKETTVEKTPEQIAAEATAAAEAAAQTQKEHTELSDQLSGTKEELATLTAQVREVKRSALKSAIAGRIPAALHPAVLQLADSLPMQATIELADDKGVKTHKSPLDLLIDILGAIPQPVQPGRLNLGDPPASGAAVVKIDMQAMFARV